MNKVTSTCTRSQREWYQVDLISAGVAHQLTHIGIGLSVRSTDGHVSYEAECHITATSGTFAVWLTALAHKAFAVMMAFQLVA
jgi:hypothetical protein